jgi:hypothetical protein
MAVPVKHSCAAPSPLERWRRRPSIAKIKVLKMFQLCLQFEHLRYRFDLKRIMKNIIRKFSTIAFICYILFTISLFFLLTIGGLSLFITTLVSHQEENSTQQVEVNIQDPFIKGRENEFRLSRVIPKYDEVISAIEQYSKDRGNYPDKLCDLVPQYLSQEPGIYIRSGKYLNYEPETWRENTPPFTFSIRGHYPFPAFMHGWELTYCPSTYSGCAEGGDRHISAFRVNNRWLWIHGSAL